MRERARRAGARRDRLARGRAGRPVRRPDRRERRRRPVRRRGAGGRRLGRAGGAVVGGRARRRGRRARRGRPAGGARRARPRLAASARRGRDRGHRLGRQDLDEGPRRRADRSPPAVAASRANFNTDIGMPLEILAAPEGTEVLVLEAAMRGFGEIATLAAICEPDVGVITNIGPVHLEQVGSLEGVARAKAELLGGRCATGHGGRPGRRARCSSRTCVTSCEVVRFGDGGDVWLDGDTVVAGGERLDLELPFTSRHQRVNALAAVAAARAVGVRPSGVLEVRFGGAARRARGAAERRHRDQRLLQRQPSVRARRPRRPRCRRRPPGGGSPCSATCSSWAPPRRSCTARSAPPPRRRASTCW